MKNSTWLILCILAALLVAVPVLAFVFSPSLDGDLFEGSSSCKPPCWNGLTPGKSSTSDVLHFLDSFSSRLRWPDRRIDKFGTQIQWIRIAGGSQPRVVDFYMDDGKLTFIQSWLPVPATLGQVVQHFGPPEYMEALLAVGPDGHLYKLEVYYPKRGLSFEISPLGMAIAPNKPYAGQIRADMPVDTIEYYQPGDLPSYFMAKHGYGPSYAQEEIDANVRLWSGFGPVQLIPTH